MGRKDDQKGLLPERLARRQGVRGVCLSIHSFARDGEVYDLDGIETLVIGGAYSPDKPMRLARGWPWFPDEQPDGRIRKRVEKTIEKGREKWMPCLPTPSPPVIFPISTSVPGPAWTSPQNTGWTGWRTPCSTRMVRRPFSRGCDHRKTGNHDEPRGAFYREIGEEVIILPPASLLLSVVQYQ